MEAAITRCALVPQEMIAVLDETGQIELTLRIGRALHRSHIAAASRLLDVETSELCPAFDAVHSFGHVICAQCVEVRTALEREFPDRALVGPQLAPEEQPLSTNP